MARPRKYSDAEIEEIKQKLKDYIARNTIPILVEFAYQNNMERHDLYNYDEFNTLVSKMLNKKEANLEKGLLAGKIPQRGAIFSLKQLGWSDKQEIDHTTQGDKFQQNVLNLDAKVVVEQLDTILQTFPELTDGEDE